MNNATRLPAILLRYNPEKTTVNKALFRQKHQEGERKNHKKNQILVDPQSSSVDSHI